MVTKLILNRVVGLGVQHKLYIRELDQNIKVIKLENKELAAKKAKLVVILNKYSDYLVEYYNVEDKKELYDSTSYSIINVQDNYSKKKILLEVYLKNIISFNKKISINNNQIDKLKAKVIPFKIYKAIITKFNDKVTTAIVNENYFFFPNKFFGAIGIVKGTTKGLKVDWGKSDKKKAQIIANGQTPYYKADYEKAKKEGREYNGVKWLVHLPEESYYFNWFRNKFLRKRMPILKDYKLVPNRSWNFLSPVKKLSNAKKDTVKAALLYTREINTKGDGLF